MRQILSDLDRLKNTGGKLVREICMTGARLFPDHFKPVQTGASLKFTFYGTEFLTRVELPIHDDGLPRVCTYVVVESVPLKLDRLSMDLEFDYLGNVNRSMDIEEAARKFLPALIKQLKAHKVFLLP